MVTPRLGRKTGPKPKFTSEDAVMAALHLGIDRFPIAGVATQLGVATSAVYRLFDSRDALVLEPGEHSPYANELVVRTADKDNEYLVKLAGLMNSPELKAYIEQTWTDGSVIPAF